MGRVKDNISVNIEQKSEQRNSSINSRETVNSRKTGGQQRKFSSREYIMIK